MFAGRIVGLEKVRCEKHSQEKTQRIRISNGWGEGRGIQIETLHLDA